MPEKYRAGSQSLAGSALSQPPDAIGRSFDRTDFYSYEKGAEGGGATTTATTSAIGNSSSNSSSGSPAYVLEWNAHTCRRRSLADARALRAELAKNTRGGGGGGGSSASSSSVVERLVVVKRLGEQEMQALGDGTTGMGRGLLERHLGVRGYLPGGRMRKGRGRWWSWTYPESRGAKQETTAFCRVSLWMASHVWVLLLTEEEGNKGGVSTTRSRARQRQQQQQQDGMTTSRLPSLYGTVEDGAVGVMRTGDTTGVLEMEMWDCLGNGVALEDTLGALVYEHWLEFLDSVGPDMGGKTSKKKKKGTLMIRVLWDALKALERNLDALKEVEDQVPPSATSNRDWKDLMERTRARISLLSSQQQQQRQSTSPNTDESQKKVLNDQAIDRIAYLGGLLLPVTVISSVLSIEGSYGPEGSQFWVFWVASAVASAVAVVIIYMDRLRTLQVWVEVATDALLEGGGWDATLAMMGLEDRDGDEEEDGEDEDEEHREKSVWVVRDGDGVRAWKKGQLGWRGAAKKLSGYYRWKGDGRMRFEAPR